MLDSFLDLSVPYWLVATLRAALLIQALWTLASLLRHPSTSARWFSAILWAVVASCAWGAAGDFVISRDRPISADVVGLTISYMAGIAWGYRQIIQRDALLQSARRFADGYAVRKMLEVSKGTPLNHVKMTSESK